MTPSWPNFDVSEISQEAADRAGIDFRSGYALHSARRSLELLSIEWANRGYNLWTVEGPTAITCRPGVERYSLPTDTVDLVECVIRSWNLAQQGEGFIASETAPPELSYGGWNQWGQNAYSDLPLTRITLPDYGAIPNKRAQGRPTLIHVRRLIEPYFNLWMVPPPSTLYQVIFWRLRRMTGLGNSGVGVPEIPWRFIPAMIAGLAYYMAMKSKDASVLQRVELLKASYEEQFGFAADEDRDRSSFYFVPWTGIGGVGAG